MGTCRNCLKRLTKRNTGSWQHGEPIRCVQCTRKIILGSTPQRWVETPGGVAEALNRYDDIYARGHTEDAPAMREP